MTRTSSAACRAWPRFARTSMRLDPSEGILSFPTSVSSVARPRLTRGSTLGRPVASGNPQGPQPRAATGRGCA